MEMTWQSIERYLRRWGRRLRLVESVAWALWGAAIGLGAGLLLAIAARLWPLLTARQLTWIAAILTASGIVLTVAAAWLRPRSPDRLAHIFDRRFALAQRLTTATELAQGRLHTTPALSDVQREDTLACAAQVDPQAELPFHVSPLASALTVVLLAGLIFTLWLPNPQEVVLQQQAATRAEIEEQIEELEDLKERIAEEDSLTEAEREALLEELEKTIAALEDGRVEPNEAVAALSEAERSLAELQDPGAEAVEAGLDAAADAMADSDLTRDVADALQGNDYAKAADALEAYAGEEGEELTREQELELAQELQEAADALSDKDPDLSDALKSAAEAIEQGEIAEAREALRDAAAQMAESGSRVESQEAVEEALAQLQEGRDEIAEASGSESTGQPAASAPEMDPGTQPGDGTDGEGTGTGGNGGDGGDGSGTQPQPGHSEDSGTGAPYDELYVPERIGEEGDEVDLGREGEDGPPVESGPLPAPTGGTSNVPYREVYAEYAERASSALEGSYIPLGMKGYVRDYFSSLEP